MDVLTGLCSDHPLGKKLNFPGHPFSPTTIILYTKYQMRGNIC